MRRIARKRCGSAARISGASSRPMIARCKRASSSWPASAQSLSARMSRGHRRHRSCDRRAPRGRGWRGLLRCPRAGGIDLTRAVRSPGSALKPFVYAFAFDEGIAHPENAAGDRALRFGLYAPENFEARFPGAGDRARSASAIAELAGGELLNALGPQKFLSRIRQSGVRLYMPDERAPALPSPWADWGFRCRISPRSSQRSARGELASARKAEERPVSVTLTSPVASWYAADVLLGAPAAGQWPAGAHRLQDRHLLRLSRRLRDRLRQAPRHRCVGGPGG